MRPFREFRVWQDAHALTLRVYEASSTFPKEELYGLASQVRRSAASIPTNIAEGSARGDREFHHFLRVALGSAAELEYQPILSRDLGYLDAPRYEELEQALLSVKRMLVTFMKRVQSPPAVANGQRPMANGVRREADR